MNILGISAFYHDSAAALISDGDIVAAAQEERFSRLKHDASFPEKAIDFVLEYSGLQLSDVDYVVFYDKPILKFERLLETYIRNFPRGFNSFRVSIPVWLKEKLFLKSFLIKRLKQYDHKFSEDRIKFSEHHLSHASSAFFPSPFSEALVLTLDGVGEWASSSLSLGKGRELKIIKEIHFPDSLGLLYSAFTFYLGFKVNSGEYKLMGLAPYGEPKYKSKILEHLIDLKGDGSFALNQSFFDYATGLTMINSKFENLFGEKVRDPTKDKLTQYHMDLAASIQAVTEDAVLAIAKSCKEEYGINNICLAGGVALNCVANGKLINSGIFDNVWVQPASGDAGGAIGAALALWHIEMKQERTVISSDGMKGALLGPRYCDSTIKFELKKLGAVFSELSYEEMINKAAKDLSESKAMGWFQGRMEFGPRALGARSILGDPRSPQTQSLLNQKIKFRESFRPFAPAVLAEDAGEWFDCEVDSPYMLFVVEIKDSIRDLSAAGIESETSGFEKLKISRSKIPAVTHVDYTARVQTVDSDTNPIFFDLIKKFKELTDCPVLVNTSFNVRGEPIVCSPSDAFRCFMGTDLDCLVIGNYYLQKAEQVVERTYEYRNEFVLD